MKCYKCGAESSSKFCPECGADLSSPMEQVVPTPPPNYNYRPNNTQPKHSGLSIAAFVVSFLGCLGFIGSILGIVDLANAKKENPIKKHGLSIAAIVIGIVFTLFGFMLRGASSNRDRANHEAANRQYESVVENEDENSDASATTATNATTTTSATTTIDYTAGMDLSTVNAFNSAMSYLNMTSFSREGLIQQLSSSYGEGYTMQQATDAVDALEEYGLVDWNDEAVRSAESYLNMTAFSRQGLIDQLSSQYGEQFTEEQATYAMDYLEENNMVDWNEQAVRSAENYLNMTSFSRQGLIDQLSSQYGEQFTIEQATYAVDQVGLT